MAIKITGQQIKQGLSKVADFFKNLHSKSTPSPPPPNPPQGKTLLNYTDDAVVSLAKNLAAPVVAESADLYARQAMDEGSGQDLVRTALQTVAIGSLLHQGKRGVANIAKRRTEKKLTGATNPKTKATYTDDEIKQALQEVDNKFDYSSIDDKGKRSFKKKFWLPPVAVIAGDAFASLLAGDSVSGNNAPKKSLYSSQEEYFNTRENIKSDYNKEGRNFTPEDEAKYNWNRLIEQGQSYYNNKSMRHLLQYQNTVARAIPNGISSLFGIDSNNVLPSAGTKSKNHYYTEDNDFMKFTQVLYQIDDAIKNSKHLNLDDDLKFDWHNLKEADKNMFADYIGVLAKKDPQQAKKLLQNLSDVGFGGKSKEAYKLFAKHHNIDLD